MGTVWRASDTLLRRDVAVKEVVLPVGLAPSDRDAMYERTLREARAAAALQHPAVVQVYDVVTEGGRPWIVMELLDARSLADLVIEDGPLTPRAVAKIGVALLGALEVAHAIGVLHRDVKPANVLICSDGRCVLTDFGVARMPTDVQLTTPGMVLGSPHFISPERAMGQEFGPPSDLFSLGVTLYTAVEGRPPFDKGDPIETMHAVVEDPPAPPVRSGPLTRVLLGLLEKDPARRFDVNTARGMLRELLAGPLGKAPTDQMTDPHAVVPSPRGWQPPTPPKSAATPVEKIGGRAMIGPGESLTDRLAELRKGKAAQSATPVRAEAALEATNPGNPLAPVDAAAAGPTARPGQGKVLDLPTGAMVLPAGRRDTVDQPTGADLDTQPVNDTRAGGAGAAQPGDGGHAARSAPGNALDLPTGAMAAPQGSAQPAWPGMPPAGAGRTEPTAAGGWPGVNPAPPGGSPWAAPAGQGAAPGGYGTPQGGAQSGSGWSASAWGPPSGDAAPTAAIPPPPGGYPGGGATFGTPAGGATFGTPGGTTFGGSGGGAKNLVGTLRNLPRKVQLAGAGALAVLLLVGAIALFSGGDDPPPPPQQAGGTPTAAAPAAPETETHNERGVSVNVPKGWRKAPGGVFVDYIDPEDKGRKVRILVEKFGGDSSHRWAEVAEGYLKKSKSCAAPYAQLAMNDVELAGKSAAEFEYNCGEGDEMRHGIWRGVVSDGKVYSFYLTAPDAQFAESKPIFDEMVRSFQLTGDN